LPSGRRSTRHRLAGRGSAAFALDASARIHLALGSETSALWTDHLRAFRQGLNEAGYVESRKVAIEYRWAEGHNERLPTLAADLVQRQVSILVVLGGTASALAAKIAKTTVPIVFRIAIDPVEAVLVANFTDRGAISRA
jgi:putative tryptophan/tyrosine transport system substrate-binding protein